jgi:hypothetical protein
VIVRIYQFPKIPNNFMASVVSLFLSTLKDVVMWRDGIVGHAYTKEVGNGMGMRMRMGSGGLIHRELTAEGIDSIVVLFVYCCCSVIPASHA